MAGDLGPLLNALRVRSLTERRPTESVAAAALAVLAVLELWSFRHVLRAFSFDVLLQLQWWGAIPLRSAALAVAAFGVVTCRRWALPFGGALAVALALEHRYVVSFAELAFLPRRASGSCSGRRCWSPRSRQARRCCGSRLALASGFRLAARRGADPPAFRRVRRGCAARRARCDRSRTPVVRRAANPRADSCLPLLLLLYVASVVLTRGLIGFPPGYTDAALIQAVPVAGGLGVLLGAIAVFQACLYARLADAGEPTRRLDLDPA